MNALLNICSLSSRKLPDRVILTVNVRVSKMLSIQTKKKYWAGSPKTVSAEAVFFKTWHLQFSRLKDCVFWSTAGARKESHNQCQSVAALERSEFCSKKALQSEGGWQVEHFHKTVGAKLARHCVWHNTTMVQLPYNYVLVPAFEFKSKDSLP